jgi:hypothetical protein
MIQAWRTWLLSHQIQQPFKQAYRELYALTAAEEQTGLYSNRFAAHILKQHQFTALCHQRGWKHSLQLMVDDACSQSAQLSMPAWGLKAEFWVTGAGNIYGADTNIIGTFLYLATDQVRFYPLLNPQAGVGDRPFHGPEPLALTEIPALVFSEVMRDVDLFVGVASVGNDPNWGDHGPDSHYRNYWYDYSFGELSAIAQTRQQVLIELIPKLKKVSDRCSFKGHFLVVKGDLHTYKIHLGSGNILMEPNDQYLCIVPKTNARNINPLFLPFDDDRTLAIILSKAFLLAADLTITDPTILNQIKH